MLIQLRVGGQAARLVDETLPPTFGVVGQETTGAGGFAKALRTVPLVLELAELTAKRGAPGAWIVDFTNPVGIVSQALLDAGHRAIGLCNVAINIQRGMAERFGVAPDRVELEHVGLNHLSWERAVRVDGVDRLPELLDGDADGLGAHVGRARASWSAPSARSRPTTSTTTTRRGQVVEDQRSGPHPGAGRHRHRDASCSSSTRTRAWPRSRPCCRPAAARSTARPPRSSSRRSTTAPATSRSSTCATTGHSPTCPTRPSWRSRPGSTATAPIPSPSAPLSTDMRGLVQAVKAYEMLAIEAAMTGDRRTALRALLANPLVADYDIAAPLLDALLEANRAYLPRFFA